VSERDAILARVRSAVERRAPHPGAYAPPPGPRDWETFASALRAVGGEPLGPLARAALGFELSRLCRSWAPGGRVVAAGPALAALGPGPWQPARDDAAPATFADVAVAVLFGSFAVAENGAVAVHGAHARVRALPFLCERLVLLVEAASVVADMHAAIDRLPGDATAHHHYTWISGPSKTADIEQALVLGAHGPRACTVIGLEG
jgi:L-lactate dehydrogenase complex protein LldG